MFETLLQNWFLLFAVLLAVGVLGLVALLSKYVRLMLNIIRDSPPPLLMGPFDFHRIEGRSVNFRAFDGTSLRGMFLTPNSLPPHMRSEEQQSSVTKGRHNATSTRHMATLGHDPTDPDRPADHSYSDNHDNPNNPANLHQLTSNLKGVVIFCHEYGSDMYSCTRYCQPLLQAGFAVFTFDFRSHGKSSSLPGYEPRLWCTDKEVSDCLGALALVHAELEDRQLDLNIGFFGISRGAGAAILAAVQAQKLTPVKAVMADSAFSSDTTIEWSMKKWVHVFARVRFVYEHHHPAFYNFLRWLLLRFARIRFRCSFPSVRKRLPKLQNTPIFFIHGERDSYIKPDHTRLLFARAQRPRYLWIVADAKHNQSAVVDPARYAARTVAFFEKYVFMKTPDKPTDINHSTTSNDTGHSITGDDMTDSIANAETGHPETSDEPMSEHEHTEEARRFFARDNKASRPRKGTRKKQNDSKSDRVRGRTQRRPAAKTVSQ